MFLVNEVGEKRLDWGRIVKFFLIGLLVFLVGAHLMAYIKSGLNNGLRTYDYGIYLQAMFSIASGKGLNPYLSLPDIRLFNDHFAPIIILAAPFSWLTNYHVTTLIIFEWLTYMSFIFLSLKLGKPRSLLEYITIAFMIVFSKGILSGITFPGHPGIWGLSIWMLLCHFLYKKNTRGILLSAFGICLFKESYPFCVFTLGGYFLLQKDLKKAIPLFLIALSFIVFVFFIRPMIWGHIHDHGASIFSNLIHHPFREVWKAAVNFGYKGFFKAYYPLIIPLYFVFRKFFREGIKFNHPLIAISFLISPYLFLHFLANKFGHQYGAAVAAMAISVILFSGILKELCERKRLLTFVLILFYISGNTSHKRTLRGLFGKNSDGSYFAGQQRKMTLELKSFIATLPKEKKIFSSPHVATAILYPGLQVYMPSTFIQKRERYDYLLAEKRFGNVNHNVSKSGILTLKKHCLGSTWNKIILENQYYLMIEGNISPDCYERLHKF